MRNVVLAGLVGSVILLILYVTQTYPASFGSKSAAMLVENAVICIFSIFLAMHLSRREDWSSGLRRLVWLSLVAGSILAAVSFFLLGLLPVPGVPAFWLLLSISVLSTTMWLIGIVVFAFK